MIRNAGGASDDAIRSLVISTHLLGTRKFGVDADDIDFLPRRRAPSMVVVHA